MVVWGLFFIGVGTFSGLCTVFPRQAFRLFEGWKFKNPDTVELDDVVRTFRVVVWACTAVVCYALGIWNLVLR